MQLNHDKALEKKNALADDKLGRRPFAESVVQALHHVNKEQGLVLAIEGKWGSGKTSTLAMVEALLDLESSKPLVVHFNPWLVGDRDVLLDEFFKELVVALSVPQLKEKSKELVQSLRGFAKEFDASLLPADYAIWGAVGKVLFSVASWVMQKLVGSPLGLQERKQQLTRALQNFDRRIVIVIDDMDRLMSAEVFEMIRIVKAIGDLPNVGYVLVLDAEYVEDALNSADVATADVYLDKIVQVRLRLPAMSEAGKKILLDEAYLRLPPEAREVYFSEHQNLLGILLESGLRKLMAQPRDVARLFNTVGMIEPALRGEIVLADIIGLSALMNFAEPVYKLLVQSRERFVGGLAFNQDTDFDGTENSHLKVWAREREAAIAACRNPEATQAIVKFLFPQVTVKRKDFSRPTAVELDGRIHHPQRLAVALQGGVGPGEVSLLDVQNFVLDEDKRQEVLSRLTPSNWRLFLDLTKMAKGHRRLLTEEHSIALFLSLTRAVDDGPFSVVEKSSPYFSGPKSVWLAVGAMARGLFSRQVHNIAFQLATDPDSLTIASFILDSNYYANCDPLESFIFLDQEQRVEACRIFGLNVLASAKGDRFWYFPSVGPILQVLGQVSPESAKQVYAFIHKNPDRVNQLIVAVLFVGTLSIGNFFDFTVKSKILEAFGPLSEFRSYALASVDNEALDPETRAALQSIVEERMIFQLPKGQES